MSFKTLPNLLFLLLLVHQVFSQEVVIKVNLGNCPTPPSIFQFDGVGFKEVPKKLSLNESIAKTYTITVDEPSFYYLGVPPNSLRLLALNGEEKNLITTRINFYILVYILDLHIKLILNTC